MHRYVSDAEIGIRAVLSTLARRFRHIEWLQFFRLERPFDPRRTRQLDAAWRDPVGRAQGGPGAPREFFAEVREQFRAIAAQQPQPHKEYKAKMRRRRDAVAGVKLILLGIALPFGYHFLSVVTFFSSVSRIENVLVFAASGLCIALGVTAIGRSGKV
jgi:hypothetical protein